ncbi:MAG: glycoside hydrolase family 2 protein, partial [bacterium]
PGGSGHAYFPGGIYEYEKTFEVTEDQAGKPMLLYFEGVYRNASVIVNGKEAGGCAYGYIPFAADLTDLVHAGENTVKVTADNSELPNSRWYSGSGIYRPVWLVTSEKDHICFEGVRVDTLSINPARIRIRTEIEGEGTVQVSVLDAEGNKAAQGNGCDIILEIPGALLWSDESPYLYRAQVSLIKDGAAVDEETVSFGIRLISWSSQGLFINGKETLLRGGCIHHDGGILGAACYDESEYRRARILKESGFNALRISHNPASRALLEACDALGLYVMDETWDMWYSHKTLYDYAGYFMDNWKEDLTKLISRDYNHPCVIMYSIGNEISEPASQKGVDLAKEMIDLIHEKDPGRPASGGINLMIITRSAAGKAIYNEDGSGRADEKKEESSSGMNSTMFNLMASMVGSGMNMAANGKKADRITSPLLDALDIAGYNYASGRYMGEGKLHPDRVIVGSETFPQDIYKNWQMVKKLPYLVGDFMWTAWDYLGECGIGAWAYTDDGRGFDKPYPWILADTGALDILGTPNGELFLAQSAWGLLKNP